MTAAGAKVAIIHPWFPQYREAFFAALQEQCASAGIELSVFYGDPPPEWSDRGDSVSNPLATHLRTRFFSVGQRSLGLKSLREFHRAGPYDLVILEQAIRNLESYVLLLSPRYQRKIAWWGHGKTYTEAKPTHEERLKTWLTRFGCWFFAYTEGGARAVASGGFPMDSISAVGNSIDTTSLSADLASVRDVELTRFRTENDLRDKTALFMGGLDASKRLPFLFEAARAVHQQMPDFRLLIVGNGQLRAATEKFAAEHPWCIYLGSRFGSDKALPMRASQVLVMPGRVGLAAVDSFAAGLPIVTTAWPFHAPEFDYLTPGINAVVSKDTPYDYATSLAGLLASPNELESLKLSCLNLAPKYSIESMTSRFFDGIVSALRRGDPQLLNESGRT